MKTETLPVHAVFDASGALVSVALLNGKATEFYQVERMAFDDIGGFLKDVTKQHEKKTTSKRSNKRVVEVHRESEDGPAGDKSHPDGNPRSGAGN